MPVIVRGSAPDVDKEPVLGTLECVEPQDATAFLRAMEAYGRIRRRDGAFRWGIYRDLEQADVHLEPSGTELAIWHGARLVGALANRLRRCDPKDRRASSFPSSLNAVCALAFHR